MDKLDVARFQEMFLHAAEHIIEQEPYLTEIDSLIGDGDHGTGMKRGCTAIQKLLSQKQYEYVDDLCYAVSVELIKTMGGASGVIFGSMFLGGLKHLPHERTASAMQLAHYFSEGEAAIERRGKAKPGDKTMLDALYPACQAMLASAEDAPDLETLFGQAYDASKKGAEHSKEFTSKIGRSKNFQDKTLGLPDPGAVSASFLFQAFYEIIRKE